MSCRPAVNKSGERIRLHAIGRGCRAAALWARQHLRLVGGLALAVGVTLTLVSNRAAITAVEWSIHGWELAGAVVLLAAAPLLQALTLRIAPRRLRAGAPLAATLRVWARSLLLGYEPTGAVGFAYRVRERERPGTSTPQVLTATACEQLAAATAGAIAAVAGFVLAGVHPPPAALVALAALAAAALALRPAWLGDRLWHGGRRGAACRSPARCVSARSSR